MMHPFYEERQEGFRCFRSHNMTFPAHLHLAAELLYVIDGTMTVTVQGQSQELSTGCAALIFPDVIHSYRTIEGTTCHTCLSIFDMEYSREYYHLFRSMEPANPFLPAQDIHPDVSLGIQRMLEQPVNPSPLREAWLHLILAYLLPQLDLQPKQAQDSTDITYQLVHYVSNHFQEPLTLEQIAEDLHFNKFYISRVFSKKLQCGFYGYVNQLRMDYAAHQIRLSDKSLTSIWQEAGFESQRTFNRVFRDGYGMTPMEYRKTVRITPK